MKNPKVSFRIFGESGPLTLSWFSGPKGNAIEATKGRGVGFFSKDGKLLCVEFDDVDAKEDHQVLLFASYRVEIEVKNGKLVHFSKTNRTNPPRRAA